jgi:formylglycine-generating enzyme required for sulfatase activity
MQRIDITDLATLGEQFPMRMRALGFHYLQVVDDQGEDLYDYIEPPLCHVPAGPFLMGSIENIGFDEELPQHTVTLAAYQIGTFPVTVAEYACAVRAKAVEEPPSTYAPFAWNMQLQHLDHPVVFVTWFDAMQYAQWLSQVTGKAWDLPTEAQWEKAARGTDGRLFSWGNEWDDTLANTRESRMYGPTPIGHYPVQSASPYGVYDMTGNVSEWTSSIGMDYPYDPGDGRENLQDPDPDEGRVARGGSFGYVSDIARTVYRSIMSPGKEHFDLGFRLALPQTIDNP